MAPQGGSASKNQGLPVSPGKLAQTSLQGEAGGMFDLPGESPGG